MFEIFHQEGSYFMSIKVGINGFGRIGRMVLRCAMSHPEIEIVGINDLCPADYLAYMVKYDTMHGKFSGDIYADGSNIVVNDPTTDRYSFKLEFDQYVEGQTCYGLDKLVLNNNYADATYMKEAQVYDMYRFLGADASLYNYAAIYVNGEYWGTYLALEAVEDSFLLRNYGAQSGALYKPEGVDAGRGGKAVTDFFDALLENETYRAQYEAYLRQLAEEYVQGGMLESFYTRTRSQIDQLVQDDPTAFYDYDAYDDAAQMLLQVVQLRGRSVLLQLSGAEEAVDTTGIDLRIMGGMNGGFGGGEAPQGGPDRMS